MYIYIYMCESHYELYTLYIYICIYIILNIYIYVYIYAFKHSIRVASISLSLPAVCSTVPRTTGHTGDAMFQGCSNGFLGGKTHQLYGYRISATRTRICVLCVYIYNTLHVYIYI